MDEETKKKEVDKRKKELATLKKELEKRKLPLVALDWDFDPKKGKGKSKSKGKEVGKSNEKEKGDKGKVDDGAKEPGRLKKMLLGPLASGPPKDTSLSSKKASKTSSRDLPAEGGPGWKPADDAVAHAAIRGGASRAENMANSLVRQKGGG